MGKIVNLAAYRERSEAQRGFEPWKRRFGEIYGEKTRTSDLSDRTIYRLAVPGGESTAAFYELIMGIRGHEKAAAFDDLPRFEQMAVVDIHLFAADQVRFEMMRRLGWIDRCEAAAWKIVEMVRSVETFRERYRNAPPVLSASHPEYASYARLHGRDKEAFIRRQLPAALEAFKKRLG